MIVIVASGVVDLGGGFAGYRAMLAAGVAAGLIQLVVGYRKYGRFADMVPPAVIHGMLAGIGIIIFAKQFPVLLGVSGVQGSPTELIGKIPSFFAQANIFSTSLGLLSLVILALAMHPKTKLLKRIPAPLIVLGLGLLASIAFDVSHDHELNVFGLLDIHLGQQLLVHLPDRLMSAFTFPDFSALLIPKTWQYVMLLTMIGSIESTLTVHAIDHASFPRPPGDVKKDLVAIGLANTLGSMIGALPMISEIARSKANLDYGATSGASNFFHGLFILIAVVAFPQIINLIPLSVLAAMLLIVAYRLASPHEFLKALKVGHEQLLIFMVTAILTVTVDVLVGITAGIALKFLIHMLHGGRLVDFLKLRMHTVETEDKLVIRMRGPAVFSNFIGLRGVIAKAIDADKSVELDFSRATLVDHTTLSKLSMLQGQKGSVTITGLEALVSRGAHELSSKRRSTLDHAK